MKEAANASGGLSPTGRKFLRILHFLFTGGWIGGTAAMTFLSVLGASTTNVEVKRAVYLIMSRLDTRFIVPLVLGSIVSGVVLAKKTPWGVFRYKWVAAKLGLAVAMVIFAVSTVMPRVRRLADASAHADWAVVASLDKTLVAAAIAFMFGLLAVIAIAVFKPWGKWRRDDR